MAAMSVVGLSAQEVHDKLNDATVEEEELWDELENEEEPAHIREKRLAELKNHYDKMRSMQQQDHGCYSELTSEKEFLDVTTSEETCICHFYHQNFVRCRIVDQHMESLSRKHFGVRFFKLNAEKCGFIVDRLKLKVLPAIYCFRKGIVIDKIIGFEDVGNQSDEFKTDALERRLGESGIFGKLEEADKSIFGFEKNDDDHSSDDGGWVDA